MAFTYYIFSHELSNVSINPPCAAVSMCYISKRLKECIMAVWKQINSLSAYLLLYREPAGVGISDFPSDYVTRCTPKTMNDDFTHGDSPNSNHSLARCLSSNLHKLACFNCLYGYVSQCEYPVFLVSSNYAVLFA